MRVLFISILLILATGCSAPDNPPAVPPEPSIDPPTDMQTVPADPGLPVEPAIDPIFALKRLDAIVEMDDEGNVLSITASGPLIVDEVLEQIGMLKTLVTLNIEYTEITDAGLAHLAGLEYLDTLILRGTEITDEGLAHLETLKTLTVLDIEFAPVTEQGVARLRESLPGCKINY